jgi:hypothetical protein
MSEGSSMSQQFDPAASTIAPPVWHTITADAARAALGVTISLSIVVVAELRKLLIRRPVDEATEPAPPRLRPLRRAQPNRPRRKGEGTWRARA